MQYSDLATVYKDLESTSKILEKIDILSLFLKKVPKKELEELTFLLQGRVFPDWEQNEMGMAARLIIKSLSAVSGESTKTIDRKWREIGDLGKVGEELMKKKKQTTLFEEELTTAKVIHNLRKITELEGSGTVDRKTKLFAELLSSADALSARYLIRTVLEELRIGVGAGVLKESISAAFNVTPESVEIAYNLTTDYGLVALVAKEKGEEGLKEIKLVTGKPIKVMLAQRVKDINEGFEVVGKPAALEQKFDGFRMQVHKDGKNVTIFTRRLEDVTKQFPEIAEAIVEAVNVKEAILEGEAIGYDPKTGRSRPFQQISQRIKRKYKIEEMLKEFPVELNIFDLIYCNGKSFIDTEFEERRHKLSAIIKPIKHKIILSRVLVTDSEEKAQAFYEEALNAGHEGMMMKNLKAIYKPGSRVGNMVKLKPVMETLELVIVGAEWGTGKRANWLSSFILACRDPETGDLLEIGKMSTGVKEKEEEGLSYKELTRILKPLIIEQKGREVVIKPKYVIEVAYEEIQKSPAYSSGFALRFPRFVNFREDRRPEDADNIKRVKELYETQRGRN